MEELHEIVPDDVKDAAKKVMEWVRDNDERMHIYEEACYVYAALWGEW